MAFGIRPSFTSIKGKITSPGGLYTDVQRYWVGPFARYYILPAENQYNLLADLSYQFGFYGGTVKGDLRTFSALTGPVIYFNSTVGLEFLLGYYSRKDKDSEISRINISKGFHIVVGLQIHLEK